MTQACQRLKPVISQHRKFLQTLSEICPERVKSAFELNPVYVVGCSLQHGFLNL